MKTSQLIHALCAFIAASILLVASAAQAPQTLPQTGTQAQPATAPPKHSMPAPTNLKVLPSNLTGDQVHEIMEQWAGPLGTHCTTCHAVDPKNIGPNGRPRLNFPDDSKPEKATARLMYKMLQEINQNTISKIDSSGAPVTCGTCHRGHISPEPFMIPTDDHDHDHDHPAPAPAPPAQK